MDGTYKNIIREIHNTLLRSKALRHCDWNSCNEMFRTFQHTNSGLRKKKKRICRKAICPSGRENFEFKLLFFFFLTAAAIVYDNHLLKVEQLQPLPQLGDVEQQSSNQTSHRTGSYMSTISLYVFPLMPAARSASKTRGCEVWIMGERRDPIPGRFVELAEEIIAFIWNGHSAFIWVNGAEGEIFSRRLTLCQHVEKGWLPENKNSCETNPVSKCWRAEPDGLIASSGNTPVNYARQLFFFLSLPLQREQGGKGYSNRLNIWGLKKKKKKIPCPITRSDNPIMDQLNGTWRQGPKLRFLMGRNQPNAAPCCGQRDLFSMAQAARVCFKIDRQ